LIARVYRHVEVENDVMALAKWIARTSRDAAYRFLDNAEESITGLRFMPGKGSPKHLQGRGLTGIRSWAVRGFANHLILYDVRADGVYVLAVVQGSRRYSNILRKRLQKP
jgi:toxin ParE1/3/4